MIDCGVVNSKKVYEHNQIKPLLDNWIRVMFCIGMCMSLNSTHMKATHTVHTVSEFRLL